MCKQIFPSEIVCHFKLDFGPVKQNCPLLLAASGHQSHGSLFLLQDCTAFGFSGPWAAAHTNHTAHTHETALPIAVIHYVEYRYFIMPEVTGGGVSLREGTKTT